MQASRYAKYNLIHTFKLSMLVLKYFHARLVCGQRPLNSVGDCPEDTTLHTKFQSERGVHVHPLRAPPTYRPGTR